MTGTAGPAGVAPAPLLVLRALGLGDALTGVPALRALRRRHPRRPLLLAAAGEPAAFLLRLGVVDGVVPTRSLDGDPPGLVVGRHHAVNLHGRGPQSHRLLAAGEPARLLAFANAEAGLTQGPRWDDGEHEVLRWLRLVEHAGARGDVRDLRLPAARLPASPVSPGRGRGRYVVLHPGAASPARRWPVDRWGAVAAELTARGWDVVVTGGPAERELAARVVQEAELASVLGSPVAARGPDRGAVATAPGRVGSLAGRLDLAELAALLQAADLLLCGDTGVAHLGTAYGTPSVLLFGPIPPDLWRPLVDLDRHVVLWHGAGRGDPHGDELDPALARIGADEVLAAASTLLA